MAEDFDEHPRFREAVSRGYIMVKGEKVNLMRDVVAGVYYLPHDGERYDYYCPSCHVDHWPDAEGEAVGYDYELRREVCLHDLDERGRLLLESGKCVYCGEDAPYMLLSVRELEADEALSSGGQARTTV